MTRTPTAVRVQTSINRRLVEEDFRLHTSTDRLFARIMLLQWLGAAIMACAISPRTWIGDASEPHLHVKLAIGLGGLLCAAPIVMARLYPGRPLTRQVIAVSQAAWSALLIHLSGGRIETHFHVFGSLAFLAFYRDWRVLVTASTLVAADHFARGVWWPQSVFGIVVESPFRWLEHTAWVIFEDVFLLISCARGNKAAAALCSRQVELEGINEDIERVVTKRTEELQSANGQLKHEIDQRARVEEEREELTKQLLKASRQAGMTEVATGVLHNVGNVLNSVNVGANLIFDGLRQSRVDRLIQTAKLMQQQGDRIGDYLSSDPRGQKIPGYLEKLAISLKDEQEQWREEITSLRHNVGHITEIVAMQQSVARLGGVEEEFALQDLCEDALKINDLGLVRHGVTVVRDFAEAPSICTEKHKVLQILVNLISNAKYAVTRLDTDRKSITIRVRPQPEDQVRLEVIDNGDGIKPENLDRIFQGGFTTRKQGHGFGLHSSALAAKEIGGLLSVSSDGEGKGASFVLVLPLRTASNPSIPRPPVPALV